jgi:hypothetical protein
MLTYISPRSHIDLPKNLHPLPIITITTQPHIYITKTNILKYHEYLQLPKK